MDFFGSEASPGPAGTVMSVFWMLFAFHRGLARQFILFICLALGFVAGTWCFYNSPGVLSTLTGKASTLGMVISSIVGGGAVHQVTSRFAKKIFDGVGGPAATSRGKLTHAGISIFPGAAILAAIALLFRWGGALWTMGSVDSAVHSPKERLAWELPWGGKILRSLSKGHIGSLLDEHDPLKADSGTVLLCLLMAENDGQLWSNLQKDPLTGNIIRNYDVDQFRRSKKWIDARKARTYGRVLLMGEFKDVLSKPAVQNALQELDLQSVMTKHWVPRATPVRG
jgi:hypothetical protein